MDNGPMWTDFFAGFLGGFGGVGVGFLLVKWLGSKFIETQLAKAIANHQHELDKQLATLQDKMSRLGDVVSRRNEREFAVTEKAWELMIDAVGTVRYELAGNFPDLIFGAMSEAEANEAIDSLPFTPTQKAALRAVEPRERQRLHFELSREHGYGRVFERWGELHRWLVARQIFLTPAIYAAFREIVDHIHKSIATLPSKFDDPDSRKHMRLLAYKRLDGLDLEVDQLAVLIRERFWFNEK